MNSYNYIQSDSLKDTSLLLINTGSQNSTGDSHKKFIIKRLCELNVKVIAVNETKNLKSKCIVDWILTDLSDHNKTLQDISLYLKTSKDNIRGVITFYEDSVLLCSRIADTFNFKGIPYTTADLIRNKFTFRTFCLENNLPSPKIDSLKNSDDIARVKETFEFPIVIKPTYGASSAFVLKIQQKKDLEPALDYILNHYSKKLESALENTPTIMAEEYIDGDEVDINILIQNGRIKFYNITDNYKTDEPFFIETGMAEPSSLPKKSQLDLIYMAEELLDRLNIQDACIQLEAKITQKGPIPLEINLRMGGDEAYYFAKKAWGVDLIENAVKIALGVHVRKCTKPQYPLKYLAGQTLQAPHSGIVSKVQVNQDVYKNHYIENLEIFKNVGDPILTPPQGFEYIGWTAASGVNSVDAADNLQSILKSIDYSIVKFDESSSVGKTYRAEKHQNAVFLSKQSRNHKIEKIQSIEFNNQRSLHIGIASNKYINLEKSNILEQDLQSTGLNIQKTLESRGYKTTFIDFNNPITAIHELTHSKIDLVFNVCERINNSSLLEPHAASIFDVLGLPYTGSSPSTLALCIDKIKVKKLLNYHNIPTPKWDYIYSDSDTLEKDLSYPLIVKPANTDNSIGISQHSVVSNLDELNKRVSYVLHELKSPALIEEYIEGDEYNIFIMGSDEKTFKVLPLSRTVFSELPDDYWHIKTTDSKFGLDKVYSEKIIFQKPPKKVSDKLIQLITEISLDTYNILDCHDYGRVEVKVDKNNNPYVLELNPNPSINVGDVFELTRKHHKKEYADFLEDIIMLTIDRYKNHPPYYHLQSKFM